MSEYARRVILSVSIDGHDVASAFAPYLLDFTYKDQIGGKSDEVQIPCTTAMAGLAENGPSKRACQSRHQSSARAGKSPTRICPCPAARSGLTKSNFPGRQTKSRSRP